MNLHHCGHLLYLYYYIYFRSICSYTLTWQWEIAIQAWWATCQTKIVFYCSFLAEYASSCKSVDNPPKLPILRHFPGKDGHIDIAEKIATDYKHFGTLLLNDDDGSKVSIIEKEHGKTIDIMVEILEQWLQGKGRMPVTWQTLVKCLQESKLHVLANSIKNMLSMNSVTSDRDHSEL